MECKHNWIETKPNGSYPYTPNKKTIVFRCVRCNESRAVWMSQEQT